MKIGINSRIYQNANTGIPYFIESLYSGLQKIDKKNEYVFFQTKTNKILGKTIRLKMFLGSAGAFLFDFLFVNQLIQNEKINIYHAPSYILPLFKKKGVKYVVTIHDLSFLIFKNNESKLFNLYYKHAIRRSLRNADAVIADSESTKRDIVKFFGTGSNKIKTIHLGVKDVFFDKNKHKRIIKEKYFFSVITHPKRKNIYAVLKILASSKNLSSYKYVIAGLIGENQLEELNREIIKLNIANRVVVFGYATETELTNLYQNAEFFIFPSFYEGFGFPVLEAMASRCPVITSDNSSLAEVGPSKDWLVDPYNIKDISDKIDRIINLKEQERNKLIEKNYAFAKKFTWKKTTTEYLKVFNNL